MEYKIKIRSKYFYNLYISRKLFEIKKSSIKYEKGDHLDLRAVDEKGLYTGSWISAIITHVVDDPAACRIGYVKLGITVIKAEI